MNSIGIPISMLIKSILFVFSCGVTKFSRMNINASQKMRLRKLVGQTMSLCEICDGPAGKKLPPFAVKQ